jgi:DNA-binding transcriptional regulator YdaS (Cro superfamily)
MTGSELRAALSRLGMSQRAFARLLSRYNEGADVTATTVNRWCMGNHPVPAAVALSIDLMETMRAQADRLAQFTKPHT